MPAYSIWFIRVGLVSLLLGVGIGAWFLPQTGAMPAAWFAAHLELLFVGWFFHFAFGVAAWILPRPRTEPKMGDPRLIWTSLTLLFVGTATAITLRFLAADVSWLVIPRVAQLGGCVAFVVFVRPRIRSFG